MKRILIIAAAVLMTAAAQKSSAQFYAARLNTLALATGTLSGGMDFTVSSKTSLDLTVYWNPLRFDAFRTTFLIGQAGVRFWRFEPNVGPFLGVHTPPGDGTTSETAACATKDSSSVWACRMVIRGCSVNAGA